MTSFFATTVPVADALWNAPKTYLGMGLDWQAEQDNWLQKFVVSHKNPSIALAATLNPEELASIASNTCQLVNDFLKAKGFNIQLQDQGPSNMLYAASVLKLLGEFLAGGETDYRLREIGKPAFRLGREAKVKHFDFNGQRVVVIPTNGGFSLLVTRPTGVVGFRMLDDWTNILHTMKPTRGNGVLLPMAKIDEVGIDVKDLCGMFAEDWIVQEELMAAKFALTPKSVRFEAAFAYSARKGMTMEKLPQIGDYVADHALYFALVKRNHWLPLAAGMVDVEDLSSIVVNS
jgi:hypothetical protein